MTLNEWGVGPTGAGLLSQFPTTPTASDEQMLANARANLARRLPVIRPCVPHNGLLSIAAGGPSLADTWRDLNGVTVAVNGSLQFLLDKGVTPWGVGVMDPGTQMKDIIPRKKGVKYFVASICDPSLFDHLEGLDVGVWHPGGAPGLRTLLAQERGENWTMVAGASTMGARWLNLGFTLGFRRFEFHGLDSSYRGDFTHAYPDHTDGSDHLVIDGYHTKLAFVRQVADFFSIIDAFSEPEVAPITIELHGEGWLQHRWKAFREMHPTAFKPAARVSKPVSLKKPETLTFATVQVGNYLGRGAEYVAKLFAGVRANLPRDIALRCVCFTDDPASLPDGVEALPVEPGAVGWWNKLHMFRPGAFSSGERILYADLDTVAVGDLTDIASYAGAFAILRDIYYPDHMGSGLMAWEAGKADGIWAKWTEAGRPQNDPRGDQGFIETSMPSADLWQDMFPGQIVSFKADCLPSGGIPDGSRVVVFHGLPRPHEVRDPWIAERWMA